MRSCPTYLPTSPRPHSIIALIFDVHTHICVCVCMCVCVCVCVHICIGYRRRRIDLMFCLFPVLVPKQGASAASGCFRGAKQLRTDAKLISKVNTNHSFHSFHSFHSHSARLCLRLAISISYVASHNAAPLQLPLPLAHTHSWQFFAR